MKKQFDICDKCLEEISKDGLMLASYYQEICAYVAHLEKPYITPRFYRPMTSLTMLEFLEMKGYVVSTEFNENGHDRLLVKPFYREAEDCLEFCGCKNPGSFPGN